MQGFLCKYLKRLAFNITVRYTFVPILKQLLQRLLVLCTFFKPQSGEILIEQDSGKVF